MDKYMFSSLIVVIIITVATIAYCLLKHEKFKVMTVDSLGTIGSSGSIDIEKLAIKGNFGTEGQVVSSSGSENSPKWKSGIPWIIQYTPYTLAPGKFYTTNLIQSFPITYDIPAGALLIVDVQISVAPGGPGIFMFVLTGDINGYIQTTKKEILAGLGGDSDTIGSITNTFKFFFTGISGANNIFNLTAINPEPNMSWGFQGNNMPDYVLMSLAMLPAATTS